MEKALQNLFQLLGGDAAQLWRTRFERIRQMPSASQIFRRIANAPDKEQLGDYLAEPRYALVFAGLGFQVEIEPLGEKGPDLGISRDGHDAYVEVTSLRRIYPGPPELSFSDKASILATYGDPERDIWKAQRKILGKFRQLEHGDSILAIWNREGDMDDAEVATAVSNLRHDADQEIRALLAGLLFIVYGWSEAEPLYCFPLRVPGKAHQANWRRELERFLVYELIQHALTQRMR